MNDMTLATQFAAHLVSAETEQVLPFDCIFLALLLPFFPLPYLDSESRASSLESGSLAVFLLYINTSYPCPVALNIPVKHVKYSMHNQKFPSPSLVHP